MFNAFSSQLIYRDWHHGIGTSGNYQLLAYEVGGSEIDEKKGEDARSGIVAIHTRVTPPQADVAPVSLHGARRSAFWDWRVDSSLATGWTSSGAART
jgi:hypothetical protein